MEKQRRVSPYDFVALFDEGQGVRLGKQVPEAPARKTIGLERKVLYFDQGIDVFDLGFTDHFSMLRGGVPGAREP